MSLQHVRLAHVLLLARRTSFVTVPCVAGHMLCLRAAQ
jgi:hypothetical protein